jgi:outer membrane cobalamin receptor
MLSNGYRTTDCCRIAFALMAATGAFAPSVAFALDGASKVTGPLVVSATRGEPTDAALPVSTTVITRDDLDHLPVATVDDALRYVTGVQLPINNSNVSFPVNPSVWSASSASRW